MRAFVISSTAASDSSDTSSQFQCWQVPKLLAVGTKMAAYTTVAERVGVVGYRRWGAHITAGVVIYRQGGHLTTVEERCYSLYKMLWPLGSQESHAKCAAKCVEWGDQGTDTDNWRNARACAKIEHCTHRFVRKWTAFARQTMLNIFANRKKTFYFFFGNCLTVHIRQQRRN